jgi:Uma2 family endonuclease
MTAVPKHKMTVDEYLAWLEGRPGRYELFAGTVYAMAPERAGHARVKYSVQAALLQGIQGAKLPCEMLPDGMTIRIDQETAHEPDALVHCGDLPANATEVSEPVVVVEVLSPSTRHIDATAKLAGYFSKPTVRHYLVVDPDRRLIVQHSRNDAGVITTSIVTGGTLSLMPPGIDIEVTDIFKHPL